MDFGLLTSVVGALVVAGFVGRTWWPLATTASEVGFVDVTLVSAMFGLLVARLTTMAIDDPGAITKVANVVVIRGGVEFWPGLLVAVAAAGWAARRESTPALDRIADLAPLAMIAYGIYEVACLARGGCYGPASSFGLRPDGLATTMIPVGALIGVVVATASVPIRLLASRRPRGSSALLVVLLSLWIVATSRSVASFWLPKLGTGLTRHHVSSLVVSGTTTTALIGYVAFARSRRNAP